MKHWKQQRRWMGSRDHQTSYMVVSSIDVNVLIFDSRLRFLTDLHGTHPDLFMFGYLLQQAFCFAKLLHAISANKGSNHFHWHLLFWVFPLVRGLRRTPRSWLKRGNQRLATQRTYRRKQSSFRRSHWEVKSQSLTCIYATKIGIMFFSLNHFFVCGMK